MTTLPFRPAVGMKALTNSKQLYRRQLNKSFSFLPTFQRILTLVHLPVSVINLKFTRTQEELHLILYHIHNLQQLFVTCIRNDDQEVASLA